MRAKAPTLEQRDSLRARPEARTPVMFQSWQTLLFAHWEFSAEAIQETLPQGLYVDTYDGKAYLGVVPFYMRNIRPRLCPAVPGISNFLEMNLRTYVYDRQGRPGVWFYSLDANQWLAVRIARLAFNLPYFDARMSARETPSGEVHYEVKRKGVDAALNSEFVYKGGAKVQQPKPGSFEFFLLERYLLFAANPRTGSLYSGQVFHSPYQLQEVEAQIRKTGLLTLAGFERPEREPEHLIMSPGVDVEVFGIEKISF